MTNLEDLKVNIEEIKNEYLKQLEDLKAKVEELTQEHESEDETDNRWKPKLGEDYWWVVGRGFTRSDKCLNTKYDEDIFNHTDVFQNEEQAEFDAKRRRIRRTLMKYGKNFDAGQDNWTFNYSYRDKIFGFWNSKYSCHPFAIYFKSKEIAEKAVEKVGEDRIKKYLFRVED